MIDILHYLTDFIGAGIAFIIVIAVFIITRKLFDNQKKGVKKDNIIKQMLLSIVVILGAFFIMISMPIEPDLRGQIISFMGIVLSAAIALSSTTFLGNAFAGLMNKIIGHYEIGDYIEIKDYFGRVSDMGLLHTEIQVSNRDLITIPNITLATNEVRVIRDSGTIISTEVSLGYDVSRVKIENCLNEASKRAGLTDSFVFITALGDYSVVYKIHGMLHDRNLCLSANSSLNKQVLDVLHEAKIEIVSPTFMNQRQVNEQVFIPRKSKEKEEEHEASPESIIFDKAMKAETLLKRDERLQELSERIDAMKIELKGMEKEADIKQMQARIDKWAATLEKSRIKIEEDRKKLEQEDKA